MRIEKDFNRKKYLDEVKVLESKVKALNEFMYIADRLSKGARNMQDLEKYVNGSTGFVNPQLSANALGILDEFNRCIELEAVWSGVNFDALDLDGLKYTISLSYLKDLEDLHRVYYEADQAKQIGIVMKVTEMLNDLDLPYRASLNYHPTLQTWRWAKQHTDANLGRTRRR